VDAELDSRRAFWDPGLVPGPLLLRRFVGRVVGWGFGTSWRTPLLWGDFSSDPGSYPRRYCFARPSGSRPSRTAVLARRSDPPYSSKRNGRRNGRRPALLANVARPLRSPADSTVFAKTPGPHGGGLTSRRGRAKTWSPLSTALDIVQRDNAETDALRARNALQSSGAGSGPGRWLPLGDSATP
jgi:hypothetical protein